MLMVALPLAAFTAVFLFEGPPAVAVSVDATPDRESAWFDRCAGPVRVSCVVDGDTFWISSADERIRVWGLDAPEVEMPGGSQAVTRLNTAVTDALLRRVERPLAVELAENGDAPRVGVRTGTPGQCHRLHQGHRPVDRIGAGFSDRAVDRDPPDVVLTDIRMTPTRTDEGVQAANLLRRTHPRVGGRGAPASSARRSRVHLRDAGPLRARIGAPELCRASVAAPGAGDRARAEQLARADQVDGEHRALAARP